MIHKNLKSFLKYAIFLISFISIFSCSKKDEYINSLPDNSAAIISFNLKELFLKSGIADNPRIVYSLCEGVFGNTSEEVENNLKDPQSLGISFMEPVYVFIESDINMSGLLAKVKSKNELSSTMEKLKRQSIVKSITSDGGIVIVEMPNVLCYYNDKRFIALPTSGKNANIGSAKQILEKKDINVLGKQAGFTEFMKEKKDIVAWGQSTSFSSLVSQIPAFKQILSASTVEGNFLINILATLNFDSGKIVFTQTGFPVNEKSEEFYSNIKNSVQKFQGRFLRNLPEHSLINAGANYKDITSLLNIYNNIPDFSSAITSGQKLGIDLPKIASSFNGDFIVDIENLTIGVPLFTLMAEVSNTSLGESVIAMAKNFNLSFVETEPGIYSLTGIAYMYNKDGIFILTTNPKVIPNLQTGFSPSLADSKCASFYKNTYGAMFINIQEITKTQLYGTFIRNSPQYGIFGPAVEKINYITMTAQEPTQVKYEVVLMDERSNALKQITSFTTNTLN